MAAMAESKRVLVVVDDAPTCDILARFFETKGYRASMAQGAHEALDLIGKDPPHLVVLDLEMPGMSGIEALKRIKCLDQRLPVVMTGQCSVDSVVAAMKLGAEDCVPKPIRLAELLRVAENAIVARGAFTGPEGFPNEISGQSPEIAQVHELVAQAAATDRTVLVYGESGTGRDLLADAIHNASRRAAHPLIRVACVAVPGVPIEAELFGREHRALAWVVRRNEGCFELANGGTLVLSEIAYLTEATMPKLLQAREDRRICPVGGAEPIDIDVRVVATSDQRLEPLVEQGSFHRDLFLCLNDFVIEIPPLRARKGDIPFLAERFMRSANAELGKTVRRLLPESLELLLDHHWPGNARELRNVVRRAVLLCEDEIRPEHLRSTWLRRPPSGRAHLQGHLCAAGSAE